MDIQKLKGIRLNEKEIKYSYLKDESREAVPDEILLDYLKDVNEEGVNTDGLLKREVSKNIHEAISDAQKIQELVKENEKIHKV